MGWIAPGRYLDRVQRLKSVFSLATASPTQLAVAEFLTSGGYDHHLRAMRRTYAAQLCLPRRAIRQRRLEAQRVQRVRSDVC